MQHDAAGPDLLAVVLLLGAAVVAVPVFRRLGLGSVLGYLAAGLAVGPWGLDVVPDPETVLHVAELGVVLFLFIIGLEMEPRRLWAMRHDIFGLGLGQVVLCMTLLSGLGLLLGQPPSAALVAGAGFALTSTAIVVQMLSERGLLTRGRGQRIVSILLFEDLSIVPLLTLVAFLSARGEAPPSALERAQDVALGLGSIALVVVAGRWLLNPMFRLLARFGGREVMTASALLVVLGAAVTMQAGGLSAPMGAFLAGVLLSESTFRHQLEADVEPFRGLLLGLFFLAVGMSLDLALVAAEWRVILLTVTAFALLKGLGVYGVGRLFGASHGEALARAATMAHSGEFAFVLYASALAAGLVDARGAAVLTAVTVVSMMLMPLLVALADRLLARARSEGDGGHANAPADLHGDVLLIGFGRFGQVASQFLLAQGFGVSIIDTDDRMIRAAGHMGLKVFFGDGARLDILHAAGAAEARAVLVCIDDAEAATRIVGLVKSEFPQAAVLVRAYDRAHAGAVIRAGADFQLREVLGSAFEFGCAALRALGVEEEAVGAVLEEARSRDAERLAATVAGQFSSGREALISNLPDEQRDASRAARLNAAKATRKVPPPSRRGQP